jgi:hypothetical protein
MKEEEIDLYPGEISVEEFREKVKFKFKQIKRHWIAILSVSIFFGVAGWIYSKLLPEYYVANILFIISASNNKQSQDNFIARQLGLGEKSVNEAGLYTVQNFLGLLVHSKMIKETLLLPYPEEEKHTFVSKYLSIKGEKNQIFYNIRPPYHSLKKEQITLLRSLADEIRPYVIVKAAEDGTSFTQFTGRFEDEKFAKYFTEALLTYTLKFYIEGKTKEIKSNIKQVEERKDSLLKLLTIKSKRIANQKVQSLDLNPVYSATMVEGQILSSDGEFLSKLYVETVASLEVMRSE